MIMGRRFITQPLHLLVLNKIPFATFEMFKATKFLCPSLLGKDGLQLSFSNSEL